MKLKASVLVLALATSGAAFAVAHAETSDSQEADALQSRRKKRKRRRKKKPKPDGGSSNKAFTHVLTLGDSYSSGTGYHKNPRKYDDHGPKDHHWKKTLGATTCYRETGDTPGPRLAKKFGAKSVFGACRGAKVPDIDNQINSVASQLPADGKKTLINITIGGNDILTNGDLDWPKLLGRCIVRTARCHKKSKYKIKNFPKVEASLTELYEQVGKRFPKSEIRVMGYPRLMQPSGGKCKGVTGLNYDEARWFDGLVDTINSHIVKAINKSGSKNVKFVSVVGQFNGHGACQKKQSNRYINDKIIGQTFQIKKVGNAYIKSYGAPTGTSYSSFHPSVGGYGAYFKALNGSL